MRLLAAECTIFTRNYHQTAKWRALYQSSDGPAGPPADNPPNSDGLGDSHWTVPELTVQVNRQPGPPLWQLFCCDPDLDLKLRSGTISRTSWMSTETLWSRWNSWAATSYRWHSWKSYLLTGWKGHSWVKCTTTVRATDIWEKNCSVSDKTVGQKCRPSSASQLMHIWWKDVSTHRQLH